jgi:hypothetical protein
MEARIEEARFEHHQRFATQTTGVIRTAVETLETAESRMKSKLIGFDGKLKDTTDIIKSLRNWSKSADEQNVKLQESMTS